MSNSVGRNDNFRAKARKLSILPTSLDIFDIRQHFVRIFFLWLIHIYILTPVLFTLAFTSMFIVRYIIIPYFYHLDKGKRIRHSKLTICRREFR